MTDPAERRAMAAESGAALLGLLIAGAEIGPAAGVVAAASVPFIERAGARVIDEIRSLRWTRSTRALGIASTSSGLPDEQVADLLLSRPTLLELAAATMEGAARSQYDERVKALGYALGEGIVRTSEDEALDQEALVVAALSDLELRDVRFLDYLVAQPGGIEIEESWARGQFPAYESSLAVLRRHALIREQQMIRQEGMSVGLNIAADVATFVTHVGIDVLDRLRQAGLDPQTT